MGWSPEGEEQLLGPEEIAKVFNLDRVSKSPAVFDLDKLNWINQQYIKKLDADKLAELLKPYWKHSEFSNQIQSMDEDKYLLLVETVREHLVCLGDINEQVSLIF